MHLKNMHELLVHELQDLNSAEQQLTAALPKLAKAARNPELKDAFTNHLAETEGHLKQVTELLAELDAKPGRTKCAAMAGVVKEGEDVLKAEAAPAVKDAALFGAAQRAEHYEMAGYGTATTYARLLGHPDIANALQRILDQEKTADETLTEIAETVNKDAIVESAAEHHAGARR